MLKYTIYYIFYNVIFGIFKTNAYFCNRFTNQIIILNYEKES